MAKWMDGVGKWATTLPGMSARWVDSHCHLQLAGVPAEVLLGRADEVAWMVVPGIDAASSRAAAVLAGAHPDRLLHTAGLHPHDAARWGDEREEIAELAAEAAAVGEIGLDFYRNLSPRDLQLQAFRDQVRLGLDLGKPLVIHTRDAFADVHRIVEEERAGPSAIMHCWTGGPRWTTRFLELGAVISFAGPIAFETGDTVRRAASVVPAERALVETDTPYLSPPPYRGETNEPARVALVGKALAGVWGMETDEVARITSDNAARVFGR
jgi:TatD DNase family protein